MKLHCPHCGVKGSAEDSYLGRKVKCPKCQGIFEVQPDMSLEFSEDATPLSPTPVESSLSADEVGTTTLADDGITEPGTDEAQSPVEAEEQIVIAEDLADPETATVPPEEEVLDWEDVAAEIDLQLAEAEKGEEHEEQLEESPAEVDLLQDEFEKPVGDTGLSTVKDDQTEDEISEESIVIEEEGPVEVEVTDVPEATESIVIAENDEKEEPEEQAQVVEKTKDVKNESNDKSSLGKLIGKAWLKIKKALS